MQTTLSSISHVKSTRKVSRENTTIKSEKEKDLPQYTVNPVTNFHLIFGPVFSCWVPRVPERLTIDVFQFLVVVVEFSGESFE